MNNQTKNSFPKCPDGAIFVFGSNLAGIHGAGAAKDALENYGAMWGQGWWRQGNSFAIPTKDRDIRTLDLDIIEHYVNCFLDYVYYNPSEQFFVTRIGCGLAGYTDSDIAPMFKNAPGNCILPEGWRDYSKRKTE